MSEEARSEEARSGEAPLSEKAAPKPPRAKPVRTAVLFEDLQRQLLRSCRPAVRRLARAARKKSDFKNELELRACLGLARIVADLLEVRAGRERGEFDPLFNRAVRAIGGDR